MQYFLSSFLTYIVSYDHHQVTVACCRSGLAIPAPPEVSHHQSLEQPPRLLAGV